MPKIQSAKKALRQNIRRRTQNRAQLKKVRDAIKHFQALIASGKNTDAQVYLGTVYKILDKTAKTKVIKSGKASRLKSRLSKKASSR